MKPLKKILALGLFDNISTYGIVVKVAPGAIKNKVVSNSKI